MANSNELTLVAQLGSGGMADVFLAVRRGFGGFKKLVVVKRLRASTEHNLGAMFQDEARLAARLNHPNVVQTFHCDAMELEMEFLDGQSLHRILRRAKTSNRPIGTDLALLIIHGLLSGLHYAHELADFDGSPLNVIHRDVSPQNVFVTYSGKVKLIDFGIAKAADQQELTQIGIVKGKVRFMAPEQACASKLDRRVDVFAAGIVMWELLTGERYWGQARELGIVRRLRFGKLGPSPDTVNPNVSPALAAICQRALAFERADRYATCADFLADLEVEMKGRVEAEVRLAALVGDLFGEERKTLVNIVDEAMARKEPEPSRLTPIMRSGVHSRSDFTALPMTQTTHPQSNDPVKRHPMSLRWIVIAAGCLAVGAMFIGLRLPVPRNGAGAVGTVARVSGASAKEGGAAPASAIPSAFRGAPPGGSVSGAASSMPKDRRIDEFDRDEDDTEDSFLDFDEAVYK